MKALGSIEALPASLEVLTVDRGAIIEYDFGPLMQLKELVVFNGATERHEIKNLGEHVVFKCITFSDQPVDAAEGASGVQRGDGKARNQKPG
jgi:hypothetical protein